MVVSSSVVGRLCLFSRKGLDPTKEIVLKREHALVKPTADLRECCLWREASAFKLGEENGIENDKGLSEF